ncbi:sigma-70 family RNA polymerase sigma factor [Zavarzinella formosa]|uniref:sigma-70 family RNA polymerase sigma factor n=1 Tax=Zavarzinella formosa TaxID=360055 RepID=UPI0002E29DCB|nr:sigma-70 family RNA polymerase sigma factor [Zavarzinella formosa]
MNQNHTQSQEAARRLFLENMRLAFRIAGDFLQRGYDLDDLKQEALIALWDAARWFKPDIRPFNIWAGLCIRKRLRRHMQRRVQKPLIQGHPGRLASIPAPRVCRGLMVG